MAEPSAPSKGSRPPGVTSAPEASRHVREMFTRIAPRYDFLNHFLSLELDRLWRARTARILNPILQRPGALVLDICCGTGDLALALSRNSNVRILVADFAHSMLLRAREKAESFADSDGHSAIPFLEADALRLPFADASFDLVTTAFGFRNLADYEAGLREIRRILKPGGTLAILEFTEPPRGILGGIYRWYFFNILPRIGGLISGDPSAYSYLPRSVTRFFRPDELTSLLSDVGYQDAHYRVWTFGTLALHTARRSA